MTGQTGAAAGRRGARRRAAVAGGLLGAYALLLAFVGYLLSIDSVDVLIPVAIALATGGLGCVPVLVANLRLAGGATDGTRVLLWGAVATTALGVAALLVVGLTSLLTGEAAVGGITVGASVVALGPLAPAALSFSTMDRR